MKYTLEQAKKILSDYNELHQEFNGAGYWTQGSDIEHIVNMLDALGLEWGDKLNIPRDFTIRKATANFHVMNSALNYKPKEGEWLIHWDNGNIGAYQFVQSSEAYDNICDEWAEFEKVLLSYNPVDYDKCNCHIVYDIKNGKRVMADYSAICNVTRAKIQEKLKRVELLKHKEEYERLLAELKEDDK